jgi:hypothetical protein
MRWGHKPAYMPLVYDMDEASYYNVLPRYSLVRICHTCQAPPHTKHAFWICQLQGARPNISETEVHCRVLPQRRSRQLTSFSWVVMKRYSERMTERQVSLDELVLFFPLSRIEAPCCCRTDASHRQMLTALLSATVLSICLCRMTVRRTVYSGLFFPA